MVKVLNCGIVESEFELQSLYYVPFRTNILGKDMMPFILSAMVQLLPLLFFEKDGFGMKSPTKVGMSWNKETNPCIRSEYLKPYNSGQICFAYLIILWLCEGNWL